MQCRGRDHTWGTSCDPQVSRWGGVWAMSQGTCPSQQTSTSSVSSLLNFWLTQLICFWFLSHQCRDLTGDISRHNILQPPGCKGSWPQKPSVIRLEPAAGVFYLLSPVLVMSLAHHHHLLVWPQHWFTFNCSGSRHSILNYFSTSSLLPSVDGTLCPFFPKCPGQFWGRTVASGRILGPSKCSQAWLGGS